MDISVSVKHCQGSTLDDRIEDRFPHIFNNKTETVQVVTLSDFMTEQNISNISLLKIDVEGLEPQVIKGAGELLSNIDNIIFESYFRKDIDEIKDHVAQYGFKIGGKIRRCMFYLYAGRNYLD